MYITLGAMSDTDRKTKTMHSKTSSERQSDAPTGVGSAEETPPDRTAGTSGEQNSHEIPTWNTLGGVRVK